MQQEPGKRGGFLSKMLHKVWRASADASDSYAGLESEAPYSKEALNQIVQRKRRDDVIRREEFAELRQLRRHGVPSSTPVVAASSAFSSSVLESDARTAATLQKIDAIEAQMAQQWWQASETAPAMSGEAVVPSQFPLLARAQPQTADSAGLGMPVGITDAQWQAMPTLGQESMVLQSPTFADAEWMNSPSMQEAAIQFAHGDLESAKALLLEMLVQALDRMPLDNQAVASIWHAVLDLYRAIGDEEGFEPLAIDYAAHFGRSAPLWFSMPEQLGLPPLGASGLSSTQRCAFRWRSPEILKAQAVARLESIQMATASPWRISWDLLHQIDIDAVPALTRLLEQWSGALGEFEVTDAERLLAVLTASTVAGDATVQPQWWLLRMVALRWLNMPQAFEQAALDYCVTYEISPPSWVQPQCACEILAELDSLWWNSVQHTRLIACGSANPLAGGTSTHAALPSSRNDYAGLTGVMEGDVQPWLQPLQAQARLGKPLEVDCALLIRLDFAAAGTLLNWAAEMQIQGHQLIFSQLHPLVAAFLQVIGVHTHAKLQHRTS